MTLVIADSSDLSLAAFVAAVKNKVPVRVEPATLERMTRGHDGARRWARDAQVYGVTTGLGPMATIEVAGSAAIDLQYNLVRSHAAGLGEPLSIDIARGLMLARIQSLTRNRSAVCGQLAAHLSRLLNAGIVAYVPRKGGVGASGDLVQLAHLALLVIGEGECWYRDHKTPVPEALADTGIKAYQLTFRDGLALVNGTSAMVAMGAIACSQARRLFDLAIAFSTIVAVIIDANPEAYSGELHAAKRHPSQAEVARRMRDLLIGEPQDALRAVARPGATLQAPYSVRCAPQIIGPMLDALEFAEKAVFHELNSVSDNPVFDPVTGAGLHGGNFHGEAVAVALDVLKLSVVKCSLLMERQLNLLLNDAINHRFQPFLNPGRIGVELGLQGVQFTATSTAAENQSLAFPMSIHSIPSNKDNQDIVSMGANAAWMTMTTIDNAFDVASILAVALSQGVAAARAEPRLSPALNGHIEGVRAIVPVLTGDRVLSPSLAALSRVLKDEV